MYVRRLKMLKNHAMLFLEVAVVKGFCETRFFL